ncbi:MAG: hypothetical protein AAF652_16060 [Cyanobacteria bacterium P01_C01_bin.72]
MNIKNEKLIKVKLTLLLGFSSLTWSNLNLRLFAQADTNYHIQNTKDIIFVSDNEATEPPDYGTPETPRGTGSRGSCSYEKDLVLLTSLVGNYSSMPSDIPNIMPTEDYSCDSVRQSKTFL